MRIPELSALLQATGRVVQECKVTETTPLSSVDARWQRKQSRPDRSNPFLPASENPGQLASEKHRDATDSGERQTCSSGLRCHECSSNGELGCCASNPCNSDDRCLPSAAGTKEATLASTDNSASKTVVARATSSTASTLACPGANGHTFKDELGLSYLIKCGTDNDGGSDHNMTVHTGGYIQCFNGCSKTEACVGFTFVPSLVGSSTSSGICYFRAFQKPTDDFLLDGSVTCNKIGTPHTTSSTSTTNTASSTSPTMPSASASPSATAQSANSSGAPSVGAIAGGVVGGIAGLSLILALLACVFRHRRKQVERRRDKATIRLVRPVSELDLADKPDTAFQGHHRSGSTAHDVFATNEDYDGASEVATSIDTISEFEGHTSTPPGIRAEKGPEVKAIGFRRPQMTASSQLRDGKFQGSGSDSMEMEDMSHAQQRRPARSPPSSFSMTGESPVLGRPENAAPRLFPVDEARREQHTLAGNPYDPKQPNLRRQKGQITASTLAREPSSARNAGGVEARVRSAAQGQPSTNGPVYLRPNLHDPGVASSPEVLRPDVYKPKKNSSAELLQPDMYDPGKSSASRPKRT